MTDLPPEYEPEVRVPPYTRIGAAELAAAVAERRVAAVGPAQANPMVGGIGRGLNQSWQRRLLDYDRYGPGFVGWMLDAKSLVASLIPTRIQERHHDGTWKPCDDPIAHAAARQIGNPEDDFADLVETWYRALDGVGEIYQFFAEGDAGIDVWLASISQIQPGRAGSNSFVVADTPDQQRAGTGRVVPASLMFRSWVKDKEWPGLARSDFQRAMPDIDRYVQTRRSIVRVLRSRLVTNGILHFHSKAGAPMVQQRNPDGTMGPGIPQQIVDYAYAARKAIDFDDDLAAIAPFPMMGEQAPEWIEVGRLLDPHALEAEVAALKAIGRSVKFPLQLLVEGPGVGNHWSDIFLNETFLSQDIAGTLSRVYRDMTRGPYRRLLAAAQANAGRPIDAQRYRLWYDISELAKRPDDTAEVLDMWAEGLIGARAARARLNVSEAEAPDPGELETRMRTRSRRVTTNSMPFAPKKGAADDGVADVLDLDAVADELNAVDQGLFAQLDQLANDALRDVVVLAGREVRERSRGDATVYPMLAALPDEQVWAAAPPYLRNQVDVNAIMADVLDPISGEAESRIASAVGLAFAVFVAAQLTPPSGLAPLVAAAGATFAVGLAAATRRRIDTLDPSADLSRWAPSGVARDAMAVAAGAVRVADPDGRPQLADGTWEGGHGPATGPLAVGAVRASVPGLFVRYRWHHGDPPHPFTPHAALNGQTYTASERATVLANVTGGWPASTYHPGDHDGCTCMERIAFVTA